MIKFYLYSFIFLLSLILFFAFGGRQDYWSLATYDLSKIGLGIGAGGLVLLIVNYRSFLMFYLSLLWKRQLHKEIRFSYSYLFNIKVKNDRGLNEFLLVRSRKRSYPAFQPVGGVYKVFDTRSIEDLGVKPAQYFHENKDLRLRFRGYKIGKVLNYINQSSNVELDHGREFYEELVKSQIIPLGTFPYLDLQKCGQISTGLRFSEHFQIFEINLYDIIQVNLTPEQADCIKALKKSDKHGEDFILVSEEVINRKGNSREKNIDTYSITEHTKRIIEI